MATEFSGQERRRRRVYVTRNTEYHFQDEVCVAVRDLRTRRWLQAHLAVNRKLTSGLRVNRGGTALPTGEPPSIGDSLYFGDEERDLITSVLCAIERPSRDVIAEYP